MKKYFSILFCAAIFFSCNKASDVTGSEDFSALEQTVLNDFTNNVALSSYLNLTAKASALNTALQNLDANTTDANLVAAKQAWKDMRTVWEQSEGFLFGPVEDYNYDPTMDDWPVNKTDLDAVLASSSNLTVSDIDQLGTTLKGFHAIEYVIFGVGSTQKAANVSARDKVYLASLGESLLNT
ncbi:MAG TPA: imelysin family protein, partial [Chitinophagaceae bacterium]|nr:imelysin family protein [Chitinophagaceae bacterium]